MNIKCFIIAGLAISLLSSAVARADEADIFTSSVKPNILFILDNSNSMDEDFLGNAAGSYSSSSKSVNGRTALTNLINTYASSMRMGLMTFRLPSASNGYFIHNSGYFISYDPRSYCPSPPPDCTHYCIYGDGASQSACQTSCQAQNPSFDATYGFNGSNGDEIIQLPIGNALRTAYCPLVYPKTVSLPNPVDGAHNIYYAQALPFYDTGNDGIAFLYSSGYSAATQSAGAGQGPYNSYDIWWDKTGSSDGVDNATNGYSNYWFGTGLVPTDSDVALGYYNFGRRLFWSYVGPTWFANSSPGNGYLNVPINDVSGAQLTTLQNMLGSVDTSANYMSCWNTGNPNACSYVINAGLTPTAGTFRSVTNYFNGSSDYQQNSIHYTSPIQYSCQLNFTVFVTDGLPSNDQNGNSGSSSTLMPDVLTQIGNLRCPTRNISDSSCNFHHSVNGKYFDIQTYVLGEGLTANDKALLDEMAVTGGTAVNGHAYYADNPAQLTSSLNTVLSDIVSKTYSFTTTSIASSRITDENYLYEASFEPVNFDPFWKGHIAKYSLNSDGSVGSQLWDAGSVLQGEAASARNIVTYKSGSLTQFTTNNGANTGNIVMADLGASTIAQKDAIVGYVRGDPTYNADNWKLGDIFHSNIVTVGTPSSYYSDTRDTNNAFATFRNAHSRTSCTSGTTSTGAACTGTRMILAGANDGQFHAFKASDGSENWSFVPPNLMPKLQYLAHSSHPTTLTHQYLADGPVVVADAWLGSGSGTAKLSSEWYTLAILSVGRNDNLYTNTVASNSTPYWSSSASCDSGFSNTYDATHSNYCGYYAFDFTNTLTPAFKWFLSPTSTTAPYLGEPWGKMAIGKVMISGNEKWVGLVGGGYAYGDCTSGPCDIRGKGFFVVDLSNGSILWSYTRANDASMNYSLAGSVAAIDADNDGFLDTVYIGDEGNNIWRFKFCSAVQASSTAGCDTGSWTGGKFYSSSSGDVRPVYTTPTVARDTVGNLWVYWGTGDKVTPTAAGTHDYLYGAMDNNLSGIFTQSNLSDISAVSSTFSASSSKDGWYIKLGTSEKMLADPVVFGSVLYYSTYTPPTGGDPCSAAGTGKLYGINYTTGASISGLSTNRLIDSGAGLATAPILSVGPSTMGGNADLFITFSGGSGQDSQLKHETGIPSSPNRNRLIYWRDKRVQ